MSPLSLRKQLDGVGRMVARWRAQLKLVFGVAAVLAFVWAFSMLDLWLQYGRPGRFVIWLGMVGLAVAMAAWVMRATRCSFTPQAVAAMLEKAFPQLDNHLINFLQFASNPEDDPFRQAYVQKGPPSWRGLNLSAMKNRRAHRRATLALLAACVLVAAPGLFLGRAWGIAVWRVVNPFSDTQPAALTHILKVSPGDTTVLQGSPVVLKVVVQGHKGHKVSLDVEPADREKTSYALGEISGSGPQEFPHRLPKVNTVVKYRFRAGDAPFPKWFTVETRPPLGFTELRATVKPPAYTGLAAREFDGMADDISIPTGSQLELRLQSNLPIETLDMVRGKDKQTMVSRGERTAWQGNVTVVDASPVRLVAVGETGDRVEQSVRFAFEPDRLPGIKVISPEGRPVLAPGAAPSISFSVTDDYGLGEVVMEQVAAGGTRDAKGKVLQTWNVNGKKEFVQTWQDNAWHSREETILAYRIVARDNCPVDVEKRVSRSAAIVFNAPSVQQVADERNKLENEAFAALSKVIEMQRENLARTRSYQEVLDTTTSAQWKETSDRQAEIRELTRQLLSSPLQPLGNLTPTAKKLYMNEMAQIIPLLAGIPQTEDSLRPARVTRAVHMEEKILRQLTFADVSAAKSKVQRRVSALSSMLARMIREQGAVLKLTQTCVQQSTTVGEQLIDCQDELAMDVTDFQKSCRMESAAVVGTDEKYAAVLTTLADACEEKRIRDDMMMACEQLEENKPGGAVPHEEQALGKLKELLAMLDEIVANEDLGEQEDLLEAIEEAKERFEKIKEVHKAALETMEMVKEQMDKSTKDVDLLEEEYEELLKNTREALLQVPTDLNIFMELNVANDIVEDVFSVFEEIEQKGGSEEWGAGEVEERALAKREEYLEGMEEAEGRLDELEQWLMETPDFKKITAEPFDQEEMPEAGIALGALKTEAEDLIGDLMEKQEDLGEEADDGAINTSVPDMVPGNEVKEGDVASFAAQGKSGNETPDHKEQDGRSNVGRQGMSVGETAAGSGTINEGDKNIEERRTQEPTQSGQVDVDGEDVDTKATGGGKLGTGKADDVGMEGGVKRMDSTEAGSMEGLHSLMAKHADAMYAKASMQNVRAGSLKDAAHHLRQASDAIAKGNIAQLKEHRKMALAAMQRAQAQLDAASTGSFSMQQNPSFIDDVVDGGPELAPPKYRELVAEYYKLLNSSL